VLRVHDEIVIDVPEGSVKLDEFLKVMAENPPWASGLPLAVEGWENFRYGKR
jgi:DNA polymerase